MGLGIGRQWALTSKERQPDLWTSPDTTCRLAKGMEPESSLAPDPAANTQEIS